MTNDSGQEGRSISWQKAGAIILCVALLVSFIGMSPARASALRASPHLLTIATDQPDTAVRVIVQKFGADKAAEQLVTRLGGVVLQDLPLINAFSASLPANGVLTLARDANVRWVSSNAPMLKSACVDCVDTSKATSAWLQTTMVKELWRYAPELQGQGVTVAVLDSGVLNHDDLKDSIALSRSGWVASSSLNSSNAYLVVDNNPGSAWNTNTPQANGQWLQVDMTKTWTFDRITMESSSAVNHYARSYAVYVSNDGVNWGKAVATGTGASPVLTVNFPVQTARYVRVMLTAAATQTWSINDFKVAYTAQYGASRIISNAAFGQTTSAQNTIEAETYTAMSGASNGGTYIGSFDNGDWLQYNNVDFGTGVTSFHAYVGTEGQAAGQEIEIRLDSQTGPLVGTLKVANTGGWMTLATQSVPVTGATGMHNLFLVGKGVGFATNIDWFSFSTSTTGIDNTARGTGQNQFNYVGGWAHNTDTTGASYNNTNSRSAVANDYVTFAFTGSQVKLYGVKGPNNGIAAVSIDDGAETLVDFYGQQQASTAVWTSPTLAAGSHTLKLRVTGTKNAGSAGNQVVPDRIDVINRNSLNKIEAETYEANNGAVNFGFGVSNVDAGDWLQYDNVDFSRGITSILANVAVADQNAGQQLEVRLDSPTGTLIGTLHVQATGGYDRYVTQSTRLDGATGIRTVYLVGKGALGIANIDWIRFANVNDEYGHGTHVAGIIGGNGKSSGGLHVGMAPKSNIINVRVNDANGAATAADVIAGLQWINDNRTVYNIKVVNISLNSNVQESYHVSALNAAVEILWFNGITVVVSAGNNGANGKVFPPANDPFVITVGATDDRGTADRNDDTIATFSARGRTEDGFMKPELVAPGVNITSLNCPTCNMNLARPGNVATGFTGADKYYRASGTSMSAAVVTGAVVLMLQRNPSLTPDQIKGRLIDTGYHGAFGSQGPRYLHTASAVTASSGSTMNTGLTMSQALTTGPDAVLSDSVRWGSVRWGSVRWGSVNWNSAQMDASATNSVSPSVYFGK